MNQRTGVQNELWKEDGSKTSRYTMYFVKLLTEQLSTKYKSMHGGAGSVT